MLRQRCSVSARVSFKSSRAMSRCWGGDPNDKCVVRATVVRAHNDDVLGAHGQAILLHHNGNQRSGHDVQNEGRNSK